MVTTDITNVRPSRMVVSLVIFVVPIMSGAEGQSRTDTGLPRPVFETGASTIPPLRHEGYSIAKSGRLVALLGRRRTDLGTNLN